MDAIDGLRFVVDECSRHAGFAEALRAARIDVVRIGDDDAPPLGASDATILAWAADEGRILLSRDTATLPGHLAAFVESNHSPGVIFLPADVSMGALAESLELVAYCSESWEWENACRWLPV